MIRPSEWQRRNAPQKKLLQIGFASLLALVPAGQCYALDIEETLITVARNPVPLADAASSAMVLPRQQIDAYRIDDLDALSQLAPGLYFTRGLLDDQIHMRGIGTNGGNQGFESAVSINVDNYYLGRGRFLRDSLFDIERTEINFGPQTVFYGRNSSAGAVNVVTASPGASPYTALEAGYTDAIDEWRGEFVHSVPLTDQLGVRVALHQATGGAWIDSTDPMVARTVPDRDELAGRVTVSFDDADTRIQLKIGHSEFDSTGSGAQPSMCGFDIQYLVFASGSSENCRLDELRSAGNAVSGGYGRFDQEGERYDATTIFLDIERALGDFTVSSATGFSRFNTANGVDADFWDIPLLFTERPERYRQLSQELRLSRTGDWAQWQLGAYFEQSDYTAFGNSDWGFSRLPPIPGQDPIPLDASTWRRSTQNGDSLALFGELRLRLAEPLDLVIAARHSNDRKSATHRFELGSLGDPFDDNPIVAFIFADPSLFGWSETDIQANRESDDFSPSVRLEYNLDSALLYASYAEGFKAGGFDLGLDNQPQPGIVPDDFLFGDEKSRSWELGGNSHWLEERLRLRFALYYTEFDDLQTLNFDGIASFVVGNAARARSRGIELAVDWHATDSLLVYANGAFGNHEFTRYPNGPCTAAQLLAGPCTQDLSGAPLPRAPERQGNLGLTWTGQLSDWGIEFGALARHTGPIQFETDNDPATRQQAFWKYDAYAGLETPGGNWLFRLTARNIGDKRTISAITDLPLASAGSYVAAPESPRTITGTLIFRLQ